MIGVVLWILALPAAIWLAGAVYYDLLGGTRIARITALIWLALVAVLAVVGQPFWLAPSAVLGVVAVSLVWWLRIPPRADRDWRPDLALQATAEISPERDEVLLRHVRHSEYRSLDDVTPRYRDERLRLDRLRAMDIAVGNWGIPIMSHPFAIFEFAPDRDGQEPTRIGFSLEVRSLRGQGFSLFRNLYRQNELFCAVADERDLIRRRVEHEPSTRVYLYRLQMRSDTIRLRFLEYAELINGLAERPRWYHAIATNCTTGVFRSFTRNRPRIDWRIVVNGLIDAYLYDLGLLDRSLPLVELRERSLINDAARGHPDEGFGDAIRRGRPGFESA